MPTHPFLIVAWATAISMASSTPLQGDFNLPGPPAEIGAKLQVWATHYLVHSAVASATGVPFRDKVGKALSDTVSLRDWCLAAVEGTVQVTHHGSARMLNYAGVGSQSQVDCAAILGIDPVQKPWIVATGKSYFRPAVGPFGDGVQGFKLVPYRTIAVDPSVLPYGTALFIPSARGLVVQLPSGNTITHDGYFFAADRGGAVTGHHIDVFCGMSTVNCMPAVIASDPAKTFEAVVVRDVAIVDALRAMHQ